MTKDTEEELRALLSERAEGAPDRVPTLADRSVAGGRKIRSRRRLGMALAVTGVVTVALAAVAVWGNTIPGDDGGADPIADPTSKPTSKPSVTSSPSPPDRQEPSPHPHPPPRVDRCADVPSDEPPLDHGVDTVFDPETLLISMFYTVEEGNKSITIDYVDDSSCGDNPQLRKVIESAIDAAGDPSIPPPPWQNSGG